MKITFNLSESTVNSATANIVDQPQFMDNDGGSMIQSVHQDATKELHKNSSNEEAKETNSSTDSGIFNIAPMMLTFSESIVNSETENLVDQPQFQINDGVSTIEPVYQNVTIQKRRHHRKPRRSTVEPVYQNVTALKSIEAVGDQPFDGVATIEPIYQNRTIRRKHKKSRHHKQRRSNTASKPVKPDDDQPVYSSVNASTRDAASLPSWQIEPDQKYDRTNQDDLHLGPCCWWNRAAWAG